jgi:parallel beta-helix repeat protein
MSGTRICSLTTRRCTQGRLKLKLSVATMVAILTIAGGLTSIAMANTVTLSPGGNTIQYAVNANPAGTTFVLEAGLYRNQSISLGPHQNGDSFIGQAGADMDGAKVLKGWTQVSINGVQYWTTAGGAPLATPTITCGTTLAGAPIPCCLPNYPGCQYVQDLYVNNVEYQDVTSLANVAAGTSWYYDFSGTDGGVVNNIYLAASENPNSDTVELGNTTCAFEGAASNITIQNLLIEKYAAPIDSSAVMIEGPNWLVQDNEVRFNHGIGISDKVGGTDAQILGNDTHNNGQFGLGGPGSGSLWDSNIIAYNNTDGVNYGYAGGSKFTGNNVTISNNIAHDNNGVGLWTDSGGTYMTYDGNTSYNNNQEGIRYEISRYGTITNNTVYGNSPYAQIVYTGSDHGRISGNTVTDNGNGAIVVVNNYGTRSGTVYTVTDVQVTGNTIWLSSSGRDTAAGLIDGANPLEPSIYTDPTNFFNNNTYEFSGSIRSSWLWGEGSVEDPISWSTWQAGGQDLDGTVMVGVPGSQ